MGGGPAGLMSALLLGRRGIRTTVLERHQDFLRDFRGDTIHPSTMQILADLGLLDEFLTLPVAPMREVTLSFRGVETPLADFSALPVACPWIGFVPQWHFLDLLARHAEATGNVTILRSSDVTSAVEHAGRVVGVRVRSEGGESTLSAALVVAADGRDSRLVAGAGFARRAWGSPMDVLWFRLPRHQGERIPFFHGGDGILVCIDRDEFWQIAYAIPARDGAAGTWNETRDPDQRCSTASADVASADAGGAGQGDASIRSLRQHVRTLEPALADRVDRLAPGDLHRLRVRIDRLRRWHRSGLIAIGDAAHAMSPAGGVGVNLAIQDAVALVRLVAPSIERGTTSDAELARVQRRRTWPTVATQTVQRMIARTMFRPPSDGPPRLPLPLALARRSRAVRRLIGRFIGMGVRPERPGVAAVPNAPGATPPTVP